MTTEQVPPYVSHWAFWCQNKPRNLPRILEQYLTKISPFTHKYQQYAALAFTISGIWIVFTITYLDLDSVKLLANALVCSQIHYCNSLLFGIVDTDLTKLQCVQNQLAHLVTKSPSFPRSAPLLRSLHWLSVKFRILSKISLLTYKISHDKQHSWACLSSLYACHITPTLLTEIKHRN